MLIPDPAIYASNSLALSFSNQPWLFACIVIGLLIILHSYSNHKFKAKTTRIATDMSAIALILVAICFLYIATAPRSTAILQVALQNVIGNGFFGAIIQACDNYITFTRYDAVGGGTSRSHRYAALAFVLIFMYATWLPFFTVLPMFYDLNSPNWLTILSIGTWIYLIAYVSFDCFYSGAVIHILWQHMRNKQDSIQMRPLKAIVFRALGHSIFSITGVLCYFFSIPLGIAEYNILVSCGIHIFMNWKDFGKVPSLLKLSSQRYIKLATFTNSGEAKEHVSPVGSAASSVVVSASMVSLMYVRKATLSASSIHPVSSIHSYNSALDPISEHEESLPDMDLLDMEDC